MVDLHIFGVPKNLPEFFDLPKNIKKHCDKYADAKTRKTSYYAWFKLVETLNSKYNIDLNKFQLKFNKNSKPFIAADIYFNISHSGDVVAFCLSDKPVGIDVQKVLPLKIFMPYVKKMFNDEQKTVLNKQKDKALYLTKLWTKYEAYVKLYGSEVSIKTFKNMSSKKPKFITKSFKNQNNETYIITFITK